MVNYQNGKIYKIVCRITGEVYIGSTCEPTLARRLAGHRYNCKSYGEINRKSYCSSFSIILRGDYYIELVENYPCSNNDELRKKEREWYDTMGSNNAQRPYISKDELKAEHRYYLTHYNNVNKETIKEQRHKFYNQNKERLNEMRRLKTKNKTEQEIEALKLLPLESVKRMNEINKKRYEQKLLENEIRKAEAKSQSVTVDTI